MNVRQRFNMWCHIWPLSRLSRTTGWRLIYADHHYLHLSNYCVLGQEQWPTCWAPGAWPLSSWGHLDLQVSQLHPTANTTASLRVVSICVPQTELPRSDLDLCASYLNPPTNETQSLLSLGSERSSSGPWPHVSWYLLHCGSRVFTPINFWLFRCRTVTTNVTTPPHERWPLQLILHFTLTCGPRSSPSCYCGSSCVGADITCSPSKR